MRIGKSVSGAIALCIAAALAAGCQTTGADGGAYGAGGVIAAAERPAAAYEADRRAILAMAGDYRVTFDFDETVAFTAGYEPKEPYVTGAREIVRVIEDRGDFISLQHILVVGGEEKFPIKHWRQDWAYEPAGVLEFTGGAAWATRRLAPAERAGKWSQVVYQVDDAPRYGAVAAWSHENGVSEWTPPASLRPLPRRDATKRDDYDAILAVNRHAITPDGWVHEQDNSKLVMRGRPHILVREVGVNTYVKADDIEAKIADDYWAATEGYWAGVRAEWARLESENESFGLTIQGEPEPLYAPLLEIAGAVEKGEKGVEDAIAEARAVIAKFTTATPAPLQDRLAAAE